MDSPAYLAALATIDAAHSLDPNTKTINGIPIPYELHYAQKMTSYLYHRYPTAPPHLHLAVRAQHFRRWETPRSSYPMTKSGYYAWRTFLKDRQAGQAAQICIESGIGEGEVERVSQLIRKEDLKRDVETQVLEDVACLVFLEDQLEGFEGGVEEEKMVGILRKTWAKMSERGREMALEMEMGDRGRELVRKALGGEGK